MKTKDVYDVPDPYLLATVRAQPTEQRINELAAEAAHHVAESDSPNAKQHNTRIIAHAIDVAVQEKRRAWGAWKKTCKNGHARAKTNA